MKKVSLTLMLFIIAFQTFAQEENTPFNQKWAFEINALWPIFPGNLYSARMFRQVYNKDKTSGEIYLGFAHRPFEYREAEGNFSNSAAVFGYRQYLWKGLNAEFYNALGPGRIRNSVVNGLDYNSIDYEIGFLLGYRFQFLKTKRTPMYVNLMPIGLAYVAFQSNPHPIVGQTKESAIYFGKIQLGIRF